MKVKVRINLHGILLISSASLVEKRDATDADLEESTEKESDTSSMQTDQANQPGVEVTNPFEEVSLFLVYFQLLLLATFV